MALRSAAWIARWAHTYLSAFGFGALVFFSVTGITLNHAAYFESAEPREVAFDGTVDAAWCAPDGREIDVARLEIVEALRAEHGVRGRLSEFRVEGPELFVAFTGAGYLADVWIDRASGAIDGLETTQGAWVLLDDLHKGRGTGTAWSWVIDVSAGLLIVAGVTGLWLLWYVRKRRWSGLVAALLGSAVLPIVYFAVEL